MERVVVNSFSTTLTKCAIVAILSSCGYGASFEDCTIICSATSGCPSGLTCAMTPPASEGLCGTGDTIALCATNGGDAANGGDGGSCLTYFDDETAFAGATSALNMSLEDFSRTANGSPTPNAFVIQNGNYFFWHDRLTFKTLGVNNAPGSRADAIAVGGNTAPNPTTIMSQMSATARDAIVASFTSNVAATAFRPSDDEGMQGYTFEITTTSGTSSFPVAATSRKPFVGVINGCGNVILSATLAPPTPSHWWRLYSVTFGP